MNEEIAFLSYLREHPDDETARGAYADWLDEHRRGIEAQILRGPLTYDQVKGIARLPSVWWHGEYLTSHSDSFPLAPFDRCLVRIQSRTSRSFRVSYVRTYTIGGNDSDARISLIQRIDGGAYFLTNNMADMRNFSFRRADALEIWGHSQVGCTLHVNMTTEPLS